MAKWTRETLERFIPQLLKSAPYNAAYKAMTLETLVAWLKAAEPTTVFLGKDEVGGAVFFYPIQPGVGAEAHVVLWNPRFFRRPALARAIFRFACRKWDLRRIGAAVPGRHKAVHRLVMAMGMVPEGIQRMAATDDWGPTDLILYGILREELEQEG